LDGVGGAPDSPLSVARVAWLDLVDSILPQAFSPGSFVQESASPSARRLPPDGETRSDQQQVVTDTDEHKPRPRPRPRPPPPPRPRSPAGRSTRSFFSASHSRAGFFSSLRFALASLQEFDIRGPTTKDGATVPFRIDASLHLALHQLTSALLFARLLLGFTILFDFLIEFLFVGGDALSLVRERLS
jgi:hypothetical protein